MGSQLEINFFQTHQSDKTYWIAYSGGLDSHVLLHLAARAREKYFLKLCAVHINHGVSPYANDWVAHCAAVCEGLNIDFISRELKINQSSEDILREHRYKIFSNLVQENDFLLTAHHQNDQAETVLLQLLRGAGPKGLAAMPAIKNFSQGFHARPLLNFTRAELENYAQQNKLNWIEDESNSNTHFTRNFLRHEIMPLLKKRWPTVTNILARTATHCAEVQELVETIAKEDLAMSQGGQENTLSVKKLISFSTARQMQILRAWILQFKFPLPSFVKMQQILQTILLARHDKMPCLSWGQVEMRRYRDDLFLLSLSTKHNPKQIIAWNLEKPLLLENGEVLHAKQTQGLGFCSEIKSVTVRFRQGGEKIHLAGRTHHHDLKKLFQSWGVSPWLRDRVPLIYVDNNLAVITGFAVAEEFCQQNGLVFMTTSASTSTST